MASTISVIEKNKSLPVFMFQGYGFRPQYSPRFMNRLNMSGPLCPRMITKDRQCFARLTGESADSANAQCEVCGGKFELPHTFEKLRELALRAYEGYTNFIESGGNVQTLDVPYEAIKASGIDGTRAIEIKWAQKDGRDMAVIYFIKKDEGAGKAHIFADMDREELRYDAADIPPGRILAKVKAEFRGNETEITYKESTDNE